MRRALQYISDLHVDYLNKVPKLRPIAADLLICGDIGDPRHKNFSTFLKNIQGDFSRIFLIPGNHEYDTSSCYSNKKVIELRPYLYEALDKHHINLLDCTHFELDKDVIIGGCTLWSNPLKNLYNITKDRYEEHLKIHKLEKKFLQELINNNKQKKLIIGTHFVHTPQLIEKKYYINNQPSDWFHTNLEEMIKEPIIGWFCGHTHSNIKININKVTCGVNHGFKEEVFIY